MCVAFVERCIKAETDCHVTRANKSKSYLGEFVMVTVLRITWHILNERWTQSASRFQEWIILISIIEWAEAVFISSEMEAWYVIGICIAWMNNWEWIRNFYSPTNNIFNRSSTWCDEFFSKVIFHFEKFCRPNVAVQSIF